MNKFSRFLGRMLHGEDVVMVRQSKDAWEHQFADGKWDRLTSGQQNTELLARVLLKQRRDGEILRVLDVGCGNGGLAFLIAGEPGIEYTGMDISETALATARQIAPRSRFIAADAEQPPAELGVFDALVFNEVFFYVNPDRALPLYRAYAAPLSRVLVSVVRSWRTPFVFRRLHRHLRVYKKFSVTDGVYHWDVVDSHFS
ncbi:MAG: class I SAM-dependent methyltransferase [Candidatus Paceibacteria bacterium]